jgi:signal transduction histidine kinase
MKLPRSIRWRILLWFGFLLGALLAGFGATGYQLQRLRLLGKVDEDLGNRLAMLSGELRLTGAPPRPRPRPPFDPARDPERPRRPNPPRPGAGLADGPADGPARPIGPDGPPNGPNGPGDGFGGRPDGFRPEGPPPDGRPAELVLPADVRKQVAEDGYYFVIWGQGGELRERSDTLEGFSVPPRPSRDMRTLVRSRGDFREAYHFNERGGGVAVGCSIAPLLADLRAEQARLWAAGVGVLALGLTSCWVITVRSLRPIDEISAAAKRIAAGELSERIAVDAPENELGELAAVLNQTFARLDEAFARQVRFTADASHELRTPLAMMISEAQTTLARQRDAHDYREALEHCHDAAQRMRALVAALLDLARLDAQPDRAQPPATIDLAAWLAEALDRLEPLAQDAGCRVERQLQPVWIAVDETRLSLILNNLFTNAVHYNQPGGLIRVTCGHAGERAFLTIQDTGQGISADDLPHIFDRFFRADLARSRAHGRVGLGLAICQAAVLAAGGSLTVTSTPGAGSTFSVNLPARPPMPPAAVDLLKAN